MDKKEKGEPITCGMVTKNVDNSYHVDFLENLFKYVRKLPGNSEPKKDGVVVATWFIKSLVAISRVVGKPAKEKISGRTRNALEKMSRVLTGNLTHSFQGRNPRRWMWGGGVFNTKLIVAISGFEDEYADEVMALIYAIYHNYMEGGIFYKYKKGNATFEEVLICELKKFQGQVRAIQIKAGRKRVKLNPYIHYILKLSEKGSIGLVH